MKVRQVREFFEIPEMLINPFTYEVYIPNENKDEVIARNKHKVPRLYNVKNIPGYYIPVYGIRIAKTINKCVFENNDVYENILYYTEYNKETYNTEYISFAAFPVDKIKDKYTHIFANVEFDYGNKEFKLANKYLIEIDRINEYIDHKEGIKSFPIDNPYIRLYTKNYKNKYNRFLIYSYGFKISIIDIEKKECIYSDTLDIFNVDEIFDKISGIDISLKYSLNAILYSYNRSFDNIIYRSIEKRFHNRFYKSSNINEANMFHVIEKNINETIIPETIYINKLEFISYDDIDESPDKAISRNKILDLLGINMVSNHKQCKLYTIYSVNSNDNKINTLLIPNDEFIDYFIRNYVNIDILKETIYDAIKDEPILSYMLGIVKYMVDICLYNISIEDIDHEIMRKYIKISLISENKIPKYLFVNETIKDKFISKLYNFMKKLPPNIIDIRKVVGNFKFTHKKIMDMLEYVEYMELYKKLMNITDDNKNDIIILKEVYNKLLDTNVLDKDEKDKLIDGLECMFNTKDNTLITINYILNGYEAEIENEGGGNEYHE